MNMNVKQKFKLRVSSVTENLEVIREFINSLAVKGGFGGEISDQITLAVDEACTNVIKHAHKYDARRMIDIAVRLNKEKIEIDISDKGKGFDISKLQKPNLEKYMHEAKIGGLGIQLMKTLMDEVNYSFNPGVKNKVTLVKYLRKKSA